MMYKKQILIAFCLLLFCSCSTNNAKVKIACIGDSITEGYDTSEFRETSYPAFLKQMIDSSKYEILNAGKSGATLRKNGDYSYWSTGALDSVMSFNPHVIVIKLGTNDTKPQNWNAEAYKEDYQAMIDTLRTLDTKPVINLVLPVPVYYTRWGINDSIVVNYLIPIVKELAEENNLNIIDAYHNMQGLEEHFPDGVHPDDFATKELAKVIKEGLSL